MIALSDNARLLLGVLLGGYLVLLFLLSLYASSKVKNEEDYLVAGRRLPLFLAWGTLIATWFGAATMTGAAQEARESGMRGVILDPLACSGTLILAGLFIAGKLWRMQLVTMGDFWRRVYGPKAEILGSAIQVPSYFGWIAAQYLALAGVQEVYFGIDHTWAILIGAGITLTYTMIGGMWSVTLTDTAQIALALVGLLVLGDVTFSRLGGGSLFEGINRLLTETDPEMLTVFPTAGLAAGLAWTGTWATGLFGNLPGQDLQQRVFSAKSATVAKQACILAGVVYFLFGMIPVGLGLVSNLTDPGELTVKILPLMAGKYLTPAMAIVFTLSFVSIVISTATSAVLAPATILGHNLLGRLRIFGGQSLALDRICVLLISLGGVTLAFWGKSIMSLLDVSLSVALVALFVPLIMGLYGNPRGQLPALLAMSFGFVTWLIRFGAEELGWVVPDEAVWTGGTGALTYAFAVIPADLLGLGCAFLGYFLGQQLSGVPPRPRSEYLEPQPAKTAA